MRPSGSGIGEEALVPPSAVITAEMAASTLIEASVTLPGAIAAMAIGLPWLDFDIAVIAQKAEGRDDVLSEILVLVVAPHQHQVRVEIIKDLADRAKIIAETLAAAIGRREAIIIAELGDQLGRPTSRVFARSLDIGGAQCRLEDPGQPLVRGAQGWPMGDAETEYFRHLPVPPR